jgi:fatty-acyl-CoA synthase
LGLIKRFAGDVRFLTAMARTARAVSAPRANANVTFADRVEAHVQRSPDRTALIQGERELSYADLDGAANRFARWAQSIGIERGAVVAVLLGNRPELVIAQLGLAKLGAVTALINHNLRGNALAHCVDVAKARCVIVHAEFREEWQSAVPHLSSALPAYSLGGLAQGTQPLDEALENASSTPLDPRVRTGLEAGDPYLYIYTSGTTGLPKAARVSHLRAMSMAVGAIAALPLGPGDRMYVALPLYHSAGGGMALGGALLSGATAVIAPKFSASSFWSDCVRHGVTHFQYIGELCRYLLNSPEHPDERAHKIEACIGNGLRPEVWGPFQEHFRIPKIVEFYGATEGNVAMINYDGTVGAVGRLPKLVRRALGTQIVRYDVARDTHERDENGHCIPYKPGEVGEAIGRISAVARFEGYTNDEATEKKILRNVFDDGDAYFRTGDLMKMDAQDYFYFVDRIGDTFRWKGENVATTEVADVLNGAPGIIETTVYGVPIPGDDGRAGMAAVVLATDTAFDGQAFYAHAARHLPRYAMPAFVRLSGQIDVTGTLKQRKQALAAEGWDPATIAEPLFVRDDAGRRYAPLTPARHDEITRGRHRL